MLLFYRNVSSVEIEDHQKKGMLDILFYLIRVSVVEDHDYKTIENVFGILQNLRYRCEEVVDPNYDKKPTNSSVQSRANPQQ
jgi:hypothetical protein